MNIKKYSKYILTANLVIIGLSLGACASTNSAIAVTRVSTQHYAPSSQIEMFSQPPEKAHVLIAHMHISGAVGQTRAQLLALLVKRAGQLGANALQITEEQKINSANSNGPATFNPAGGNYDFKAPMVAWSIHADALRISH